MNLSFPIEPKILVASDNVDDAALVKKFLDNEFAEVFTSTDPAQTAAAFDRHRPDVLVLVFDRLENSKTYYLGLYRLGTAIHLHPHRTIVLCAKEELQRAYTLCREGVFDDYMLFWPATNDAPALRLPMSVHLALRELAALTGNGPTAAEFAAQARRLETLESHLAHHVARAEAHIESAERAVARAGESIGATFDVFSQRLARGELRELIEVKNADGFEQEMKCFKRTALEAPGKTMAESVRPLKQWTREFRAATAPHLESVRELNTLIKSVQVSLLVVDDDEFQHKIIASLLKEENYRLLFASNGVEALSVLRKIRPDLILMDVMLPGTSGMEIVVQIRAVPRLVDIPIIMITGKREKTIVMESVKAGANDFLVKPFAREILLAKVKQGLQGT